jgi:hypothetical protein
MTEQRFVVNYKALGPRWASLKLVAGTGRQDMVLRLVVMEHFGISKKNLHVKHQMILLSQKVFMARATGNPKNFITYKT